MTFLFVAAHSFEALLDRGITSNTYFAAACFSGFVMIIGALFALLAKLSIDRRLLKVV